MQEVTRYVSPIKVAEKQPDIFFIQERLNKLICGINTNIKCGI